MTELFAPSGPLSLWTERSGDPSDPAVLLIAGASAQGYTTPDAVVGGLVARGLQVIRYDHRDTGRSSVVDTPYGLGELTADAVAVLDAYELESAHIAGGSMGGMIAQWMGLHEPSRVRSLSLLSTSPIGHHAGPVWQRAMEGLPADPDDLPPPAPSFLKHLATAEDATPGVESDMVTFRILNGDVLPFDEAGTRAMLERCWARAIDPSAADHHGAVASNTGPGRYAPLSTITAPTTVIHGDQDPIYPPGHGEALAAAIPGARLHIVPGMGHAYFAPGIPEKLAALIAAQ